MYPIHPVCVWMYWPQTIACNLTFTLLIINAITQRRPQQPTIAKRQTREETNGMREEIGKLIPKPGVAEVALRKPFGRVNCKTIFSTKKEHAKMEWKHTHVKYKWMALCERVNQNRWKLLLLYVVEVYLLLFVSWLSCDRPIFTAHNKLKKEKNIDRRKYNFNRLSLSLSLCGDRIPLFRS